MNLLVWFQNNLQATNGAKSNSKIVAFKIVAWQSSVFHILTDNSEVFLFKNWYIAFWQDALHSFGFFPPLPVAAIARSPVTFIAFLPLFFYPWWQSVTLSTLTASQRAKPVVSPSGESIIWAGIDTKGPYPGPATDLAGSGWLMNRPTAAQGKKKTFKALETHTFSMHPCTNTLTPRYGVICHSEINTYKCVCWFGMRMHSCMHGAMPMLWLNLSSTAQHGSHLSATQTNFLSRTKFGLPQSLTVYFQFFALRCRGPITGPLIESVLYSSTT